MAYNEPGVWSTSVPNRSPTLVIVSIVFLVITTFFWIFRQGWRWAHRQRGMDDAMAACAYIVLVIQTVLGGMAVHYGFGKHMDVIKPTLSEAMQYFYLYQICYKLLGGFTKLTFCFLYLRIFNQKGFQRLVIAVSAIVAVGSLAFALGTVFQCLPVERAWNRKLPGHCISNTRFWYTHAAFNIFFDIVVYIMPIPLIRTLKLARGQKTGLISIFCLGAFVIVAAIVRMVMLYSSAGSTDPTWGSMIALYWTEIEANTSVICCCLPTLRVPVINLWHKARHGKDATRRSTYERPAQQRYPGAWSGPQQKAPVVSHGPTQPEESHQSDHNRVSSNGSHSRSTRSHSSLKGQDWYDRAFQSLMKDNGTYDATRSESQEELSQAEQSLPSTLPPTLELGAIYKTTDLHVSTQKVRLGSEAGHPRKMSLSEVLVSK